MKLSTLKNALTQCTEIRFILPNGSFVSPHFHVTEVGRISKYFIDCGGVERTEQTINFQLFEAEDFDHRLSAEKLLSIIQLSENKIGLPDSEIEVEYQEGTIAKYGLDFNGANFLLTEKRTACLAEDQCGIPKKKVELKTIGSANSSCTPGSGCC
jgi:hypothetical protein